MQANICFDAEGDSIVTLKMPSIKVAFTALKMLNYYYLTTKKV